MKLSDRIRAMEQRRTPEGMLPVIVRVPADEPERQRVLADVERRRKRGEHVLAVHRADDPMVQLCDLFI